MGSTEWAEAHAGELRQHAVVYLNSDSNSRGFLEASGSNSLERLLNEVARDIQDPEKNVSVWQRARARNIVEAASADERKAIRQRPDLQLPALGSGSDYTVFLDHLGVASLNLGFGGEDRGGIYHSTYDDFYWYTHFADTDFSYGRVLSQTVGTAAMRLADADVLPFDFASLAEAVRRYSDDLQQLLNRERDEIAEQNQQIADGDLAANADPKLPFVSPAIRELPPHLNFAPLLNASEALTRSAEHYRKALDKAGANAGLKLTPATLRSLNEQLIQSERRLTYSEGLPGRPWYKHILYAPGLYTGYGVKTIPGVREAIEQRNWKEAEQQIVIAAAALQDEAALIEAAARTVEGKP